jgi:hypothetical protein
MAYSTIGGEAMNLKKASGKSSGRKTAVALTRRFADSPFHRFGTPP